MCNSTDHEEPLVSLRGKGVLVVGRCLEAVRGVVGALEAEGAHVLVASAQAFEWTQVLAGGVGGASPHVARGLARGLVVNLSSHSEILRVFRWVDGMLPRLDVLVSVVDIENVADGGCDPPGNAHSGESGSVFEKGDAAVWRSVLEEQCLVPLELLLAAASRMRLRRAGHLLQIGVQSGGRTRDASRGSLLGFSRSAGCVGTGDGGLAWEIFKGMLEARRMTLAREGVRMTLLEVFEGSGECAGACCTASQMPNAARDSLVQSVCSAVLFCLHAPAPMSVEHLRVGGVRRV